MDNSTSINIDSLDYGQSCTYGVISNCGYPKIDINQTNIDVVVASLSNSSMWSFDNPLFQFDKSLTETLKSINGKLSYTYGNGEVSVDASCGTNRVIFVTITNLNAP